MRLWKTSLTLLAPFSFGRETVAHMRIFVPSVSFLSSVFLYVIEIKQVKLLLLSFFH